MSGLFDDALVQEIRDRNDIVSVIGDYVSLKKAGAHYKGLCPFHNEKTPSFTVHPGRQFYYCFGCQASGDVITFVRETHGFGFIEALRHLGDRVGIAMPERRRTSHDGRSEHERRQARAAKRSRREQLFAVGREARRFYADTLGALEGDKARKYLRGRGVNAESIERFALGYAPDAWDRLSRHVSGQGSSPPHDPVVSPRTAELAGLVAPRKSGGGHYDRFRDRLMFPVRNLGGEVIAFSGRTLGSDPEAPKYVNSPETDVYTKGDTLYGLYEARKALRQKQAAIVVEGNVDLVMLSQAGLEHVVAPMGTALTQTQCRLLKRFVPRAVLLYDGDRAGRAAALKAIPTALAEGLQVAVATLPDGEDPDSFVRTHGAEALEALLAQAPAGFGFLVEHVIGETRAREDARGKLQAIDRLAPVLTSLGDRRERELHRRELAMALDLPESQVHSYVQEAARRQRPNRVEAARPQPGARRAPQRPTTPAPHAELELVRLLLLVPDACALYLARDVGEFLTHQGLRHVADALAGRFADEQPTDVARFLADLPDATLRQQLFEAVSRVPDAGSEEGSETAATHSSVRDRFEPLYARLRSRDIDRKNRSAIRASRSRIQAQDEDDVLRQLQQGFRRLGTKDGMTSGSTEAS